MEIGSRYVLQLEKRIPHTVIIERKIHFKIQYTFDISHLIFEDSCWPLLYKNVQELKEFRKFLKSQEKKRNLLLQPVSNLPNKETNNPQVIS